MATPLPVSFAASPLPTTFKGTPQQLLDAYTARLQLVTTNQLSLFVSGSTAPLTNSGPWLKNGITWYVWDVNTGAYIPEVIEFQSLRYIAQQNAPDPNLYTFWIVLDASGNPTGIEYFGPSSMWVDIYAIQSTALQNQIQQLTYISYPAAVLATNNQILTIDGTSYVIEYGLAVIDPYNLTNGGVYNYTAPVSGDYVASARIQVDNINAQADALEFNIIGCVNGANPGTCWGGASVPNPPGSRWYPQFSGMVHMNAGDTFDVRIFGNDQDAYNGGVDSGTVNLSNGSYNIHLVKADTTFVAPTSTSGEFLLSSGSATVANTLVTANSIIEITLFSVTGTITQQPFVTTKTAGVGFTVQGGSGDNSTYVYRLS